MENFPSIPEQMAAHLLNIQAVQIRLDPPFTWTSGIQAPIYCDNRLIIGHPFIRNFIAETFASLIREQYPQVQVIAGTATAAIPHAAWVAEKLNLPMVYIRSQPKAHGTKNQIEGPLIEGQRVIVIEDLISTGKSVLKAAAAVREVGALALAVCAIFNYAFESSQRRFDKEHIFLHSLCTYNDLLAVALSRGFINQNDKQYLQRWRNESENDKFS